MRPKFYPLSVILVTLFLMIFPHLKAQDNWTDPTIISDTLTDNRNATLGWLDYYGGEDYYFFWEKTIDDSTTAICARKYYDLDEPVFVLSDPGVKYTNPQLMGNYPYTGTPFILFYQSDENGGQDIYYRTYSDNQFSPPYVVSTAPGDDEHVRVNELHSIVWERNDTIFHTHLVEDNQFDTLVIIDTEAAFPEIIQNGDFVGDMVTVAWEKMIGDSSQIFIRTYNSWLQQWTDPMQVSLEGHNTSMRFCNSLWQMNPNIILWDNLNAEGHTVQIYDVDMDELHEMNFRQGETTLPAMYTYFIPLYEYLDGAFLTFVYYDNDSSYIMGHDGWFSTWLENYSPVHGDTLPKHNLAFFGGKQHGNCFYDVINIWEEEKNGLRQLWSSYYPLCLYGGIEESEQNPLHLSVSPNPATEAVTITYDAPTSGSAQIRVFNATGQLVEEIILSSVGKGEAEYIWNPREVLPGIYMIKVSLGKEVSTAKLLLK